MMSEQSTTLYYTSHVALRVIGLFVAPPFALASCHKGSGGNVRFLSDISYASGSPGHRHGEHISQMRRYRPRHSVGWVGSRVPF